MSLLNAARNGNVNAVKSQCQPGGCEWNYASALGVHGASRGCSEVAAVHPGHRRQQTWASVLGSTEVVKILLAAPGIAVNTKDKKGHTPLLSASGSSGCTALHEVCFSGKARGWPWRKYTVRTSCSQRNATRPNCTRAPVRM